MSPCHSSVFHLKRLSGVLGGQLCVGFVTFLDFGVRLGIILSELCDFGQAT